jgi:GntR family transcriptional repressor for pyruvate dehydrogenase complex
VRFHALLAESTGNPIFGLLLQPLAELLIQSRRKTLSQFGADLAAEHHARILDAVARRRAKAAAAAMEMHLRTNAEHLARFDGSPQDHQR